LKRKLTTILCADGVRFSALMEADEAGTLERLNRHRAIMAELFQRHDGRQVNTWGDMVIAEFSSPVEAVRCAVEVQDAVNAENRDLPEVRRMLFRVGINLGDVMLDGGDLYGDGVNVAARLQSLAEPGGVMVSGTVHELTRKQLAVAFDYAGQQQVKSIAEPVEAWRVRLGGGNAPDAPKPRPSVPRSAASRAERALGWLRAQPRRVQYAAALIPLLFTINLVTTELAHPWFLYPSIPLAFYILLRSKRGDAGGG
jgi:adenylate cyclase